MADDHTYPDDERADDLDSLLAQAEALTRAAGQVTDLLTRGRPIDLLYIGQKARAAERAAAAVADDARLIYDRQGGERWLGR